MNHLTFIYLFPRCLALLVFCSPALAQTDLDKPATNHLKGAPTDSLIDGYVCPMHPNVTAEQNGQICYLCGMALVDGRIKRPHASHEPHNGGVFFMSRDNWHHVEGTLPDPGVFHLYVYDNYSLPMPTTMMSGRLVFQEFWDQNGQEVRPPIATPLVPSPDGVSFTVVDDRLALERDFNVRLRFRPELPEEDRFDFTFYDYSRLETGRASARSPWTDTLVLPETPGVLFDALLSRVSLVDGLLKQNRLNQLFYSALAAKDLALALLKNPGDLDEEKRAELNRAVTTIVRAAWRLDQYGDYGDRPGSEAAFRMMTDGVERIKALYPK